jgi:hypothetical protein
MSFPEATLLGYKRSEDSCSICFESITGTFLKCVNGHEIYQSCFYEWVPK